MPPLFAFWPSAGPSTVAVFPAAVPFVGLYRPLIVMVSGRAETAATVWPMSHLAGGVP